MVQYDDLMICALETAVRAPRVLGFRRAHLSRWIAPSSAFPRRDDNDGEGRTDEVRDANAKAVVRVIPR